MQITIELPKAFSVRDVRELTFVQDLMTRLNSQVLVAQVATGIHIDGGPTAVWALVYMDGQPPKEAEIFNALREAGLDMQHNAEIPPSRIWVDNQLEPIEQTNS